jgi:hypothetical protein
MTSLLYGVTVLQYGQITTHAFQRPVDLVRFLMRPGGYVLHVARVFEIPFQHPVYLGTVTAE